MPPGRTRVQVRDAGVSGASSLPTGGLAASLPSGEGLSLSLSLRCPRSRPAHRTAPHLAQVRTWPSPASHWGRAHHRSIEVGVLLVTVVPQLVETLECPVFRWVQVARTSTGPPCEKKKKKKKKTRGGGGNGRVKEPRGRGKDFPKISFNISWKKTFVHEEKYHTKYSEISQVVRHPPAVGRVVWPRRSRGEEEGGKPWGKKLR